MIFKFGYWGPISGPWDRIGSVASANTPERQHLIEMILQGGWAMIPLGLCSITMLYLLIHGFRETQRGRFLPARGIDPFRECLGMADTRLFHERLRSEPTMWARVLLPVWPKWESAAPGERLAAAEESVHERLEVEEARPSQWIHYLNVIASVAPMIGLLGTVSGMISAFQTIGLGGMGKPEALAGDIGEALITTATGLSIGIPAMIGFFILRNRLASRVAETREAAQEFLEWANTRWEEPPSINLGHSKC